MNPTPRTRRIGRLRTLVVLAAMAVGMIAGTAAPALADANNGAKGLSKAMTASQGAPTPWADDAGDDFEFEAQGWSWLR